MDSPVFDDLSRGTGGIQDRISLNITVCPYSTNSHYFRGTTLLNIIWSPVGTYTTEEMIQLNPGAE